MKSGLAVLAIGGNSLIKDKKSVSLQDQYEAVKETTRYCISLMKMSPLAAVLKCPHYGKGHYINESERAAEVPSFRDGYRWEDHLKGCW